MPSLSGWRMLAAFAAIVLSSAPAFAGNPCVTASSEGQDQRASSRFREARASFLKCSAPTCNPVVRASCEKWLAELEEQQPSVVVRVVDAEQRDVAEARVTIDDVPIEVKGAAVPVDPGFHVIKATGRSGEVLEQRVLFAIGEKARLLELRLPAAPLEDGPARPLNRAAPVEDGPAPAHSRPIELPLALAGVAVVAVGAFTYFEITGHADYHTLERSCFATKTCMTRDIDHVKAEFVGAGISVGIAAAALVAAAVVYFASGSSAPAGKAARWAPLRAAASF